MESLGSITEFVAASPENRKALRFYLQSIAREIVPNHRIKICWRHRLPDRPTIDVVYIPDRRAGHIQGLMKCASGWVCPVCAARISEQRRIDLQDALNAARGRFIPVMVTYTARHGLYDPLHQTLDNLLAAYRTLRQSRAWRTVKSEFAIVGSVRATEITHTENGWHPHFHELMLLDAETSGYDGPDAPVDAPDYLAGAIENHLTGLWLHALNRHGMSASTERGLQATAAQEEIGGYISKYGRDGDGKWTVAHEIAKSNTKTARVGGKTPFGLLWDAGQGDEDARYLFREFVKATKGKSQLQWARGTRSLLGLDNVKRDEDITAEDDTADHVLLAKLSFDEWKQVIKLNAVGKLLDVAATGDAAVVGHFVAAIMASEQRQQKESRRVCMGCVVEMDQETDPATGEVVYICPYCGLETT